MSISTLSLLSTHRRLSNCCEAASSLSVAASDSGSDVISKGYWHAVDFPIFHLIQLIFQSQLCISDYWFFWSSFFWPSIFRQTIEYTFTSMAGIAEAASSPYYFFVIRGMSHCVYACCECGVDL